MEDAEGCIAQGSARYGRGSQVVRIFRLCKVPPECPYNQVAINCPEHNPQQSVLQPLAGETRSGDSPNIRSLVAKENQHEQDSDPQPENGRTPAFSMLFTNPTYVSSTVMINIARMTLNVTSSSFAQPRIPPIMANKKMNIQKMTVRLTKAHILSWPG